MNIDVAIISFLSLLILIVWPLSGSKIPAPMIVVLVGIVFAWHFDLAARGSHYLVGLPDNVLAGFYFPDFAKITTLPFWGAVLSISLVGSIETLLVTTAVDKLDPYQRKSDLDRDLAAIGLGNIVAGFLGGLPMIAEIVRSSANIQNGAKTAWANFFHGLILLLFVVLFTGLIQRIPLACLAALLVYTGYRLCSPATFMSAMTVGKEQLLMFVITLIGIVASNIVLGVALGIAAKLLIHLARGVWPSNLFKIHFTVAQQDNDTVCIKLLGSALFSNYLPLKKALTQLADGKTIIFDCSDAYLMDHTVMEFIHDHQQNYIAQGGLWVNVGTALEKFSDHALAARLMTVDDRK
jgi:MFS superfamily sulfate permease-like transporter